jgi:hypothetical protein
MCTYRFASLIIATAALWVASIAGCGPVGTVGAPYETCDSATDVCSQGLACLPTTLPAATGFTGELCTTTCTYSTDCPQDITNYASICVNGQCYTQCPAGSSTCPYGTACLTFSDQTGRAVDICAP